MLGAEPSAEGLFAVVPLRWAGAEAVRDRPPGAGSRPRVVRTERERSRRVFGFEAVQRMQQATLRNAVHRPAADAIAPAVARPPERAGAGGRYPLPAAASMPVSVREALRARRSSFGRFVAGRPLRAAELAGALDAAVAGAALDSDATAGGESSPAAFYVFATHVEGVPPGAYAYHPAARELQLVRAGAPGAFLQRNYFLSNYNVEQAGAVIVPAVRTAAVLDAGGDPADRVW
ncbi:hypothetical protein [Kitasatospora sp. NPDC059571]|uniref:hypothetical protein n=1 Tax=Kitasatospora sp. NPDC059571 TaxID=3346871 RepID=UPI00369B25CD